MFFNIIQHCYHKTNLELKKFKTRPKKHFEKVEQCCIIFKQNADVVKLADT